MNNEQLQIFSTKLNSIDKLIREIHILIEDLNIDISTLCLELSYLKTAEDFSNNLNKTSDISIDTKGILTDNELFDIKYNQLKEKIKTNPHD